MDHKQKRLLVIGAIMAVVAIVLYIAASIVGQTPTGDQLNKLSALETEILTLNEEASNLNPDLDVRRLIANSNALAANDISALEPDRSKLSGANQIPKEVLAEVSSNAKETLSAAAQRNDLGGTYKKLLAELIDKINTLVVETKNGAKDNQLKQKLDNVAQHIEFLKSQTQN